MEIHKLPESKERSFSPAVMALGNFDGLHIGHRNLIQRVLAKATDLDCDSGIFTFDPHPMKILPKGENFRQIWPRSELINRLKELQIDHLYLQKFTKEFSQLSAPDFIEKVILPLNPKAIVVGFDFHFGVNRSGSPDLLKSLLANHKVVVEIVKQVELSGKKVSSRSIKDKLAIGQLEQVQNELGERFYVKGEVDTGHQRGNQIGFPTANLKTSWDLLLKLGVYKTKTYVDGVRYESITNVGLAPTFEGNDEPKIETHILNFNQSIYGQTIKVEFERFVRPEMKFESKNALVEQIKKDIRDVQG